MKNLVEETHGYFRPMWTQSPKVGLSIMAWQKLRDSQIAWIAMFISSYDRKERKKKEGGHTKDAEPNEVGLISYGWRKA